MRRSIAGVVMGVAFGLALPASAAPLDAFTRCLSSRGAVFYGTDWCPHCRQQSELFGRSARFVRYVECNDGSKTTPTCRRRGIRGYPTWTFRDGSRVSGRQSLAKLASKTGCRLPR